METGDHKNTKSNYLMNNLKKETLRRRKVIKLIKLYKKLHKVLLDLESREIDFQKDSDEEIEKFSRRFQKISAKRLSIHKFLVKNKILIDDDGQVVDLLEKPRLFITTAGNEDLNQKLTEFVNKENENIKVFGLSMPFSHVSIDDVRALMEEVNKERESQIFSSEDMVENVACEVNKQIKLFIEENHRIQLDEWILHCGEKSSNSLEKNDLKNCKQSCNGESGSRAPVLSWEDARMELCNARERGDIGATDENEEGIEVTEEAGDKEESEEGSDKEESEESDKEEVEKETSKVITLDSDDNDECILIE